MTNVEGLLIDHRPGAFVATGRLRKLPPGASARDAAVFGSVTTSAAAALVQALRRGADPGRDAPEVPWAACAVRPDGVLALTGSMLLQSGLFWSVEPFEAGWRLVAGTEPLAVVRARTGPTALDEDQIRGLVAGRSSPTGTPYRGLERLPPGDTLTFDPRTGRIGRTEWCGPATVPPPTRSGPGVAAEYLETFDRVTQGLAEVATELVVGVSGGLDSTFLTASLAHAAPGRRVHGYCYRPFAAAGARPTPGFDPDDFPLAALLAARYPAVSVEALSNTGLVHPLDAAEQAFRRSGWPEYACTNTVWLDELAGHARRLGAGLYFLGMHGNATFSNRHAYADPGRRIGGAARDLARFLRYPARGRAVPSVFDVLGLREPAPRRPADRRSRSAYLEWACTRRGSLPAAANPARTPGLLAVDPYTARSVVELAASIRSAEWRRGTQPRALARRLGEGRVPDPIRLRTRRGGQSGDVWFVVRRDPARLAEEVDRLLAADLFDGLLDRDRVAAWLDLARRTAPEDTPPPGLPVMLRMLSARRFADWAADAVHPVDRAVEQAVEQAAQLR